MVIDRRRYGRQSRLADVGESGQAKLCAAKVAIGSSGFVRTIEHRYVVGAGMTATEATPTVDPDHVERAANVASLGLRHAPAREVAEGALRALVAIRAALEVAP
jgi:molybdopterin/thiamine biosynthesis adenylyltransferase